MTISLKNDCLLRSLRRQAVPYTPIWLMRQAGRYLPEYRAVRARAGNFMTLCKTPELACEVTLQPLQRYDLDAAIIFSDILTIPDAMGLGLEFAEGEGPIFAKPIRTAAAIQQLHVPDPEIELAYVMQAIRLVQSELAGRVPLIGFAGSPWTLATYMVEGSASKTFAVIRKMLYQSPELLQQLLAILTQAVISYLNAQIAAGVQVVMLFDTWGGLLTTPAYQQFSLAYMQQIQQAIHDQHQGNIPCIMFTKGGSEWLELMADSGCQAVGIDWTITIDRAKARLGNKVALQGNMDPAMLYAEPAKIRQEVQTLLAQYGHAHGHIFNLGHGLYPDIPPDHVGCLVDAVHEFSPIYHQN